MTAHDTLRTQAEAHDTATLIGAMTILDAKATKTPAERMVLLSIYEVLEARHPEVDPIMESWSEDLETDATYAQALTAALAEVTA